jgi:uncharacterized damage-inducible protein DinB
MQAAKLFHLWDRIRFGTVGTIEMFDEDELDFISYRGGYSVRQIILHIAQEEYGEIQYGITGEIDEFPPEYPPESYPTIDSLKGLLADVHDKTRKYLESISNEDLEKDIEAGWGGVYPMIDMIWHVLEHEIHHRGELSLILGLLGKQGLDA